MSSRLQRLVPLRLVPRDDAPRDDEAATRSDAELTAAIVRGETELGAEICKRLLHVVDATLFRMLGRRESDHDDLVQSALEQVLTTIYSGKFSGRCSLTTWASSIACHVALHAIRRRKSERKVFDDAEAESRPLAAGDTERQLQARQELERVREHLSHMSAKLAETLVLHDMMGFGLQETARLVNASAAATQSRLARGRKELAERLQRDAAREKDEVGP